MSDSTGLNQHVKFIAVKLERDFLLGRIADRKSTFYERTWFHVKKEQENWKNVVGWTKTEKNKNDIISKTPH